MPGQQRNRSSSPQKKVKGPMGTVGEKGLSKKEQTQILLSLKAMFDGQIEPEVIEMVLMEKSWKVDEAVQILSSMVEEEKPSRSDSFSQFDLIAFSLLDSTPDVPEQRQILEEIQSTSNSSVKTSNDNIEVTHQAVENSADAMTATPKAAPVNQQTSKKTKDTPVQSKKGKKRAELETSISIPIKQSDNMAAKHIKTPPGLKSNQPPNSDCKVPNLTPNNTHTLSTSNSGSLLKRDIINDMAGLSNFTSGHHDMSADFSLQSYLDMYGENFGLAQQQGGFWGLSEGSTKEHIETSKLSDSKKQKGKGHVKSISQDTCIISQLITADNINNVENNRKENLHTLEGKLPENKYGVPMDAREVKADNVTGLISKVDAFLKDSATPPVHEGIQKKIKKRNNSKSIASRIQDSTKIITQRVVGMEFNNYSKPDKEKPSSQFLPQNFNMVGAAKNQPSSSKLCPQAQVFQPQQDNSYDLFTGPPVFMTPVGPRISPPKPYSGSPKWVRLNRPQSPHFRPASPKFGLQRLPLACSHLPTDDTGFMPVVHKHHYHHNQQKQSGKELFNKYQCEGRLILVLLRGLPGSGKSYLAKQIVGEGIVLSTDEYFFKDGVYQYDPNELSAAHTWNKQRAINAMEAGINPVIIDNTNIKVWEMKPYGKSAIQNNYSIVILEPDTPWKFKPRELQARNTHGVSKEIINKMKDRYDNNVTVEQLLSTDKPVQPTLKLIPSLNTSKNNNIKIDKCGDIKIERAQNKSDSTLRKEELSDNNNLTVKKEQATDSGINMEEEIQNYFEAKKEEDIGPVKTKTECKEYPNCSKDPWNEKDFKVEKSVIVEVQNMWKEGKGESVELNIANDVSKSCPETDVSTDCKGKLPSPKPMRTKKRNRHNSTEVKKEQPSEMAETVTISNELEMKQSVQETDRTSVISKENSVEYVVIDSNDSGKMSEIVDPMSENKDFKIDGKIGNCGEKTDENQGMVKENSLEGPKPEKIRHSSSKSSNCSEASYSSSVVISDELVEKSEESCSEEFFDANTSLNQSQNCNTSTGDNFSKTETTEKFTIQNPDLDVEVESSGKSENNSDSNQNSPRRKNRRKKRTGKPLLDKEFKMKFKTESWNSFTVEDFKEATLPVILSPECDNEANVSDSSTLTEGLDFKFLDNVNLGMVDPSYKDYVKIITAKSSKINECTPDTKSCILRTFGLDKGCMTDDLTSSLEPNLDFLRTSFPELSDERCTDILEMCQNDVEWAINLILDCGSTVSLTSGEKEEIASEVLKLKRGNSVTSPDVITSEEENNVFINSFSPKTLFDICNEQMKSCHLNLPEIQQTLIKNGMKQLEQMETHALTRMKSISHENVLEENSMATGARGVSHQKSGISVKSSHEYRNSISYILNEDILRREGVVADTQALKMLGSYDSSDSSDENETLNSVFQSSLKKMGTTAIGATHNPGADLLYLLTSKSAPSTNTAPSFSSSLTRIDSAIISAVPASTLVSSETLKTVSVQNIISDSKTLDKCNENGIKMLKTIELKDSSSSLESASTDIDLRSESVDILAELKEVTPVKSTLVYRDISSPIDDIETELSVKLPSSLVSQLEQLFGQITVTDNQDDQEIYLDLKAAKHLHRCLKLTTQNQTVEKHAQLRNDEALARRMQEEENKPSLRVRPKLQPKTVFLEDIIQEELARKNFKDKNMKYIEATKDHIAIATKLKRQKLLQKYPGLDETFFEEIFQTNGYSYEDTDAALKSTLGPDIPVKTVMTAEAEEEYYSKLIDEAKQNSLQDMSASPASKKAKNKEYQDIESYDLDYQEVRGEADLHRRLRQQCFVKAREAFQRGMREVSSFYSQQGHLHSQKLKDANTRASKKILESRQLQVQREMTLDLHGFHVEEAIVVLNRIMLQKEKEFSARPDRRRQYLYVITGRGLNSRGGVAKIRPAILSHLKSNNVRFMEEKPGLLKVQLKYT